MAETAEEVIERLLDAHRPTWPLSSPHPTCEADGCDWSDKATENGAWSEEQEANHRAHVAAEVATALREAGALRGEGS